MRRAYLDRSLAMCLLKPSSLPQCVFAMRPSPTPCVFAIRLRLSNVSSQCVCAAQCAYSSVLERTRAYSSVLERTRAYSSVLERTRAYSCVLEHTRAYSSVLESTRAYSCVLVRTRAYSSVLERTRAYSSVLVRTRAYSSVLERTRAYSSILERTRAYSSVCASTRSAVAHRSRNGQKLTSTVSIPYVTLLMLVPARNDYTVPDSYTSTMHFQ